MSIRTSSLLLLALSSITAGCGSAKTTCNVLCIMSVVLVDVPPDRRADVVGVSSSGACNPPGGATCVTGDAAAACATWSIQLTSAGSCSIHVRFQSAPDAVFTTSVSHFADQCCSGFSSSPSGTLEVPSLSDGGADSGD
jgi:hypothetical protein